MKKNIEVITREIKEEKITYEAVDGTIFTTEEECKKYEETAKCAISEAFNKLNRKEPEIDYCDDFYLFSSEDMVNIIEVSDVNELMVLNSYFLSRGGNKSCVLGADAVGQKVLLQWDPYALWINMTTEKDFRESLVNKVDRLFGTKGE